MNPWGLFLIIIGFLMIVVGVKGTQSQVLSAFKGVKQGQTTGNLTQGGRFGGPGFYTGLGHGQ